VHWIAGEGTTEKIYFEALKQSLRIPGELAVIRVIHGTGGGTKSLAREVDKELKRKGFKVGDDVDQVWLVFDSEPHDPQRCGEAESTFLEIGKKQHFQVAVSCPSVELWFLLHFADVPSAKALRSPAEAVSQLKKHIPGYQKGRVPFSKIDSHRDTAKKRAHALWKNAFPNHPATNIHLLVTALEDLAI
jgi:hypothetical protein